MKLNSIVLLAFFLSLTALYSCSRQASIPTLLTYTPTSAFDIPDSLLAPPFIPDNFFTTKAITFFEPALEVRDSFNRIEKTVVGYADEQFFARRQELILDLVHMEEGSFFFPLPGAKVLSSYGSRNGRLHSGIDLKVNRRDTVMAAFDGIVRMTGWSRGYGNVVVIRHYNGLETVYAHNSKHLVHSGDRVKAGAPISITGETGRATTDHVHFEIRVNGKTIDPNLVIDFNTQTLLQKRLVFTPSPQGGIQIESV